jgi:pyruvate formate lyase activating enzyme
MSGTDAGIVGWLKNSYIDFPGTVSTVLFFRGCNLHCPWCHNPSIVNGTSPPVDTGDLYSWLQKRGGLIDGVVLTGGEPTLHTSLLPQVVAECRRLGYAIKLDTNGLRPDMIELVSPDYLAMDLKTDPMRYHQLGWDGGDCTGLLVESLNIVRRLGNEAEVRITVAAPFVDESIVDKLLPLLDGVKKVFLQPVNLKLPVLQPDMVKNGSVSFERLEVFREKIAPIVSECTIRGDNAR